MNKAFVRMCYNCKWIGEEGALYISECPRCFKTDYPNTMFGTKQEISMFIKKWKEKN